MEGYTSDISNQTMSSTSGGARSGESDILGSSQTTLENRIGILCRPPIEFSRNKITGYSHPAFSKPNEFSIAHYFHSKQGGLFGRGLGGNFPSFQPGSLTYESCYNIPGHLLSITLNDEWQLRPLLPEALTRGSLSWSRSQSALSKSGNDWQGLSQ